jgi:hypothetical protein
VSRPRVVAAIVDDRVDPWSNREERGGLTDPGAIQLGH